MGIMFSPLMYATPTHAATIGKKTATKTTVVRRAAVQQQAQQTSHLYFSAILSSGSATYTTLPNGLMDVSNLGTYYIGQQDDQHAYDLAYADGSVPASYQYSIVTQDPAMQKYISIGGCTTITLAVNGTGSTCTLPAGGRLIVQTQAYQMGVDGVKHPQVIPVTVGIAPIGGAWQYMPLSIYYYYSWR